MKVLWFHLMPYPDLPDDFRAKHRSVWVDLDAGLLDAGTVAFLTDRPNVGEPST